MALSLIDAFPIFEREKKNPINRKQKTGRGYRTWLPCPLFYRIIVFHQTRNNLDILTKLLLVSPFSAQNVAFNDHHRLKFINPLPHVHIL